MTEYKVLPSNGTVVSRYFVIGATTPSFEAWETADMGGHGSITFIEGHLYGKVTTRRLPAHLDAIPYGDERIASVRSYYDGLRQEAQRYIEEAFPVEVPA